MHCSWSLPAFSHPQRSQLQNLVHGNLNPPQPKEHLHPRLTVTGQAALRVFTSYAPLICGIGRYYKYWCTYKLVIKSRVFFDSDSEPDRISEWKKRDEERRRELEERRKKEEAEELRRLREREKEEEEKKKKEKEAKKGSDSDSSSSDEGVDDHPLKKSKKPPPPPIPAPSDSDSPPPSEVHKDRTAHLI